MDSTKGNTLEPPSNDPTTYCRLCMSVKNLKRLPCHPEPLDFVQVIWKQIGIQLTDPYDLPCAICALCVDKLEELYDSNRDGLLDEWEDQGLLEYKDLCRSVDNAIRNSRLGEVAPQTDSSQSDQGQNAKTVILPFQQLNDGRYRCNECHNMIFDAISACIRHYQEDHPNSSVTGLATESTNSAFQINFNQTFDCVECGAQFGNLDDMINHRRAHSAQQQPKQSTGLSKKTPANASTNVQANNSAINGNTGKRPYLKCINCYETFDDIDELIKHRTNVHTLSVQQKKKKYPRTRYIINSTSTMCKVCHIDYGDRKPFYKHLLAVHDQYLCYICDRTLPSVSKLTMHMSHHRNLGDIANPFLQGKNSFHCKVCFEKFRTEGEIRMHFEMNHADLEGNANSTVTAPATTTTEVLRITCTKCLTSFNNNEEFEQHQFGCIDPNAGVSIVAKNDVVEISDEEELISV
ncbi:zinc finger protein 557-like [Armigeres subalbatus]|uniref:zinc finger protein 557-like n=1 Tax=Armigeres subalbatus TaxID=124917 RepID=UPI002ED22C5A